MRKAILLLFAALFIFTAAFAQQPLTGKVLDKDGLPLAGVNITNKKITALPPPVTMEVSAWPAQLVMSWRYPWWVILPRL